MNKENIIIKKANKTVYRDGDTVVKAFSAAYSKADVLNEALNQARVEETGLHIPKIRAVTVTDGKWSIVSDYIEGKNLQQLMNENPDKTDEYLKLFVELQLAVHATKSPLLAKQKDKFDRKIIEADLDVTTTYELHTRLESMPRHKKVCHGDFNPSNIVITADGTPYILDWAHATQGNASADAANTYLQFWLAGDTAIADKYLELFCLESKIDRKYVQGWLPIVSAVASVSCDEKDKNTLLRWVDVMDYS